MARFPRAKARLTSNSNEGPDAIITFEDNSTTSVQITTAHHSKNEALGRELMVQGKPCFPTLELTAISTKGNGPREIKVIGGHGFTTRAARISKVVNEVKVALNHKIENYKLGTDALLISGRMSPVDAAWEIEVRRILETTTANPYRFVFVGDTKGIYIDFKTPARLSRTTQ